MSRLTSPGFVVKIDNMHALLITHFKDVTPEGDVIELIIWKVPTPVPPSTHGYKYRAAYVVGGERVIGFDNERGKGDHCHIDGHEADYTFNGPKHLVEDFIAAIDAKRKT